MSDGPDDDAGERLRENASDPDFINSWILDMGAAALPRAVEVFRTDTAPLIAQIREAVGDDVYFGLWLLQADASLRAGSGLSILDLDGSWPWKRAYLEDRHPGTSATRAMASHPKWGLMIFTDPDEIKDPPRPAGSS